MDVAFVESQLLVVSQLSFRAFWTRSVHLSGGLAVLRDLFLIDECIHVIYLTCCTEVVI